ncbi:MAG: lipoate--protein ligase [Desulfovibrionaceae bacterium]|nr:lipoate--protein ligase [Desulfovibrionaceae bacterium]
MQYLRLTTHDPSYNLAVEEALFSALNPDSEPCFMLWQNGPSVIVGCHQNAMEEVNAEEVRRRSLPVVRRSTGGGAVYHDLGNLNFSFLEYRPGVRKVDFRHYLEPIVRALGRCGVDARISGRNDLEAGGRKISGSAQRLAQGRVLHHGTLLVDADFEDMTMALHPDPEKYMSKGVASVRARVANISEFWKAGTTLEDLCGVLADEMGAVPADLPEAAHREALRLQAEKYGRWEWNIGASPKFTSSTARRFPWGRVQVCLQVEKGIVTACRIYGDFFAVEPTARLEALLTGCQARREAFDDALKGADLSQWFSGCQEDEMRAFLLAAL